ncbi:MAG: alpha-hydroxy-acid oxidizing protein [Marinosulfonomonas sp.]|nr:alpha-hydroxy-acid oxidizing protein [Marinosulfonomonas sp.]
MDLDTLYPAISDLRARAQRRIPHFAWEFLDSGTGTEDAMARNRSALKNTLLQPGILKGEVAPDLSTQFLGQSLSAPFGIAPVGMSGLMWPDAERLLAQLGAGRSIPYCMSNVSTQTPEHVGPHLGDMGWFQLYAPRDLKIRADMLSRVRDAGFHTLVLTVDVPVASRRERQRRGGLTQPPRLTPRILAQVATCPAWALRVLRYGMPQMRFMQEYSNHSGSLSSTAHIGYLLRTAPDWQYLRSLRDEWPGKLIVKGVLQADEAPKLVSEGVDAIWVSNHAGRQFDAAPASLDALGPIRKAVGPDLPLIYDGGIESGLDILRAIALGADLVMLGRAFHYGLGALGERGGAHVADILREDIIANLGQMGIAQPIEARNHLI